MSVTQSPYVMHERIDWTGNSNLSTELQQSIIDGVPTTTAIQEINSLSMYRRGDEARVKKWARGTGAPVLNRELKIGDKVVANKINNKIQHNFLKRMARIRTGYLGGNAIQYNIDPVNYRGTEQQLEDAQYRLKQFLVNSNMSDIHSEVISDNTLIGQAGKLLYIDGSRPGDPILNCMFVRGENCVFIGDGVHPVYSVRYVDDDRIEVYDDANIYKYSGLTSSIVLDEIIPHNLSSNPLIPYYNNIDALGNAEDSYGKINDVDEQRSNLSSLLTNQRLAMKVFIDLEVDDEAVTQSEQLAYMAINTKDGKGSYHNELIVIPSEPLEKHIEEVERSIYLDAGITNIEDKQFGNESGEAKKYYLITMESNCKDTESKHKAADFRMLQIFCDYWRSLGVNIDPLDITMTWKRNLPLSRKDDAEWATKMIGIAPRSFVYQNMDTVEDPARLEQQYDEENQMLSFEDVADGIE